MSRDYSWVCFREGEDGREFVAYYDKRKGRVKVVSDFRTRGEFEKADALSLTELGYERVIVGSRRYRELLDFYSVRDD